MKRFPFGLTAAAAIAIAILIGLGVWQLERLAWKEAMLARIEALAGAPARPLGEVLARAAKGQNVEFTRVAATCSPATRVSPLAYRYALRDGRVAWRLLTPCAVFGAPWSAILLDRGLVTTLNGSMAPRPGHFSDPASVTGVLRSPGAESLLGPGSKRSHSDMIVVQALDRGAVKAIGGPGAAPYFLAVESETPAPLGVSPAALPQDIPNNHFIYALTWFALAGILAWFYGAMLWRRLVGR